MPCLYGRSRAGCHTGSIACSPVRILCIRDISFHGIHENTPPDQVILSQGFEAQFPTSLIADELAKEGLPAFVGPSLGGKSKIELLNKSFRTPADLHAAGVSVSIITDAPVIPLQHLPLCAGLAVNAGLEEDEAWRAITITPATQLGVGDRVGSLEPGKDGDVVIWTADPLRTVGGEAAMTIVTGQVVYSAL